MRIRVLFSCLLFSATLSPPGGLSAHAALGFGGPSLLNNYAPTDASDDRDPQIATDGLGNWVAVWQSSEDLNDAGTDADIFVSRSTNNGDTWSEPAFVNTDAATDQSIDSKPQLVTDLAGNWLVVWVSAEDRNDAGSDLDIFCASSNNNGATWSAPVTVNTNATTDSGIDRNPHLATDAGDWIVVWDSTENLSGSGTDADIIFARSSTGGSTWADPKLLNTNATTDSGTDEDPRIATDFLGNWIAVWESDEDLAKSAGEDDDIFVSISSNAGETWSAPALLNSNATTDTKDDFDVVVASGLEGNWIAMWSTPENIAGAGTDDDIFVSRSTDNGATWSAMAPINNYATSDLGSDFLPRVAANGSGGWVAIWLSTVNISGAGTDRDVFVSRSTDGGASWGAPGLLNGNATTDTRDDLSPHLATDRFGNWAAVWYSNEDLQDAGTDFDIFFSFSSTLEDPMLSVLTPNGGEKWKLGKKKKITWTSAKGLPLVKIELLRNGNVVKTIKGSTNDDGKHKWKVKNVEPGNGYAVRVTSISDPENSDDSDGTFKINAAR